MIYVQLLGGLGNQMFQYAAGRALAHRHDVPLRMDVRSLGNRRGVDTPRPYSLQAYALEGTIASSAELRRFQWRRLLGRAVRMREQGFPYNPSFEHAGSETYLEGYWQSERYFADIASIIRREFTVCAPPSELDSALLDQMADQSAISVHIRRGDYVSRPAASAFHGVMPLDYYQEAAGQLVARVCDPSFFVFSDDPIWARDNLKLPGPMTMVDHHGPHDAHQDMRLMRACKHHIIANSSFSWWGAWLSENPDKIVVAPRQWFRESSVDTSDLCPPAWIRL